jgi:hypothetical protein
MVQGLNFHVLNADGTLHGEKLYLIYAGFWLGPQKMNPNYRKILNQETLNHFSTVLLL